VHTLPGYLSDLRLSSYREFSWELSRKFMAKLLYGWEKKKYKREREKRWDKNWS